MTTIVTDEAASAADDSPGEGFPRPAVAWFAVAILLGAFGLKPMLEAVAEVEQAAG